MPILSRRAALQLLAAAAATPIGLGLAAPPPGAEIITFLHFNDIYEVGPKDGHGGFATLATLLTEERAKSKNTITTFGGDLLSPSILSGMTKGAPMVDMCNSIGVQVAVPGNHEYDFGPDNAVKRYGESKFPWVVTNVAVGGKIAPGLIPYWITEIAGFKVGFFGLLTPSTAYLTSGADGLEIQDPVVAAKAAVKTVRDAGAEVVIALTHLDYTDDLRVAREVRGIDLILGGHDHVPMTFYEFGVLVYKAGADGFFLGSVDLAVSRVTGKDGKPQVKAVPVGWKTRSTIDVAPDPAVKAKADRYEADLDRALGIVIGLTKTQLDSRKEVVRSQEAAIGNLIADAARAHVKADATIVNGGGIRGNRIYEPDTQLTRKDILAELPFGNVLVMVDLKGADLRAALEQGVSAVDQMAGRFPQISGVSFAYDPKKPAGQRVFDVKVGGTPLDDAQSYKVATADFLYHGGDGYTQFARGKLLIDPLAGSLLANVVTNYIEAAKDVAPKVEGRSRVAAKS